MLLSVLAHVKADAGVAADPEKETSVVKEDFSVEDGGEFSDIDERSTSLPRAPVPGTGRMFASSASLACGPFVPSSCASSAPVARGARGTVAAAAAASAAAAPSVLASFASAMVTCSQDLSLRLEWRFTLPLRPAAGGRCVSSCCPSSRVPRAPADGHVSSPRASRRETVFSFRGLRLLVRRCASASSCEMTISPCAGGEA